MRLIHGDALGALPELASASIDAVITDPPYELGFMGRAWDASGIAYSVDLWRHCLRVVKPGGHLLAFGGSRTYHRLAVAVEDAGFELRDSIMWIYGSGFPKSLDVSKAIDKAAGAEREVIGKAADFARDGATRKTDGSHVSPGSASGTLNEFGDRSPADVTTPATDDAKRWAGWGTALKPAFEPIVVARKPLVGTVAANVLAHGTGALNIDACRVETTDSTRRNNVAPRFNGDSYANGETYAPAPWTSGSDAGRWPTNVVLSHGEACADECADGCPVAELGEPARFFPVFRYQAKAPTRERPKVDGVAHPTVKPLDLMRWLVRLVTPPGGLVLDPFAGSGTTLEAAALEAMDGIGIEREAAYLPLIAERMRRAGVELDAQSLAPAVPRSRTPAEWLAHFGITEVTTHGQ